MSKKQYLVEKLANIKQKAFNPTHSSLRRTVTQLMLVVMLWQALVEPAVIFASSGNGRDETKTTKESTKNTSVATSPKPLVQGPGEVVITRHAPSINGSRIEGTVRVLLGESINVNSNAAVTGDLLVPGSPTIRLNGNVNYNGTVVGTGNPQPDNYAINLNSNVSLRHIVTRTDATQIDPIANPPQPTGTRDVALNRGQDPGDFASIRNLIVNSNYGQLVVPEGTYGAFAANSNSGFTFGVAGQNTTYNLQSLTLNSNSKLEVLGSVTINIQGNVSLNSQTTMGDANSPALLSLNISQGSLTLNSNSTLSGVVKAPNGQVSLNANSLLKGLLTCDRLVANSNSKIQGLISDVVNPVVTITEPQNGAVFNQAQVTVTGTVEDESVVTVKVNNVKANFNGTTFSVVVPLNLGSNILTAVATDAFNNMGQVQVTVSRTDGTNQAPVVDAGPDLNANLNDSITLNATVNDDGKPNPPGQLTITWTKESGPGNVTFTSPNTAPTNVTFSAVGSYVLKLSASDSQLSSSDTVTITVTNNQANQAPVVNAGQDATVTLPAAASLNGTVTDDGLPSNQLTIMWSKQTGPGTVIFANAQSAQTTATFSEVGVYTLRLSASDGELTTSDEVLISVAAPTANFSLMAAPTSVTTVQNTTATYMINVISSDPNFRNLISLSVSGVPGTARAIFEPQQVVAGSNSTLTIDLNNSGVATGTYNLTVTGTTPIGSMNETHSISITLIVQAATQTTLSGRVLSTEDEPLSGVTVSIDGQSATTDAAGAFLLSGVLAGNNRAVMVDGRTASSPGTSYPVIAEPVNIIANQPNQMPYTFYLPRIDTQFEVSVVPNQDTTVTTPRVDNLQTLIPAGANLRNRDGSPVTRVSMTPVAIDRTPAPLPANVSTNLVYTNQPGGAIADVAMPVIYPNLGGLDPGTIVNLYTFNHDTVEWEVYGFGKVSSDGRTISPEIDPATNKPYGLRDFSWHLVDTSCVDDCDSNNDTCSNPEANGVQTDIGAATQPSFGFSLGGARGGLSFSGMYSTKYLTSKGYLGFGTRMNYEVRLTGSFAQGGAGRIAWPQDKNGWLFNYSGTDTDGALVFTSTAKATLLGDKIRKLSNGTLEYISKNQDKMKFDSNGRLTAIVDRNNNTTTLTYTGNNLTQVTDPVGRSMNLTYDGQDKIIQATDPIGRSWTFTYTTTGGIAGILATVTDPLGHTVRYGYNSFGQLETVTDKRNNVVRRIEYDSNARVIKQTWADGGFETYQYFFAGSKISAVRITNPENRVTIKRFNGMGYVIFEVDGLGQPSLITRDINTNLTSQTNGPCGCPESIKTYNSKGDTITVIDRLGQIMRYEYDNTFSFVTKITDKNGHITRFTYDSRGNRTSVINAKNEVTTFVYDQFGQQTSMTDALNHTWSMVYDAQGNVTSKSDPLNHTSTMTYDGIGRMLSMSDPLGRTSSMMYDAMSRVTSQTDPAGATTTYTYDQNGNQLSMTNALNNTWTMEFDAKNRMISQRYPLTPNDNGVQREARMEYNKNDEPTALISPSARTTRYSYDARGQRKTVTDPLGATVAYNYDINRNLISLSDQRNNTTTWEYDELYRVTKVTDPSNKFTRMSYDSDGNILSIVDRLNRITRVSYDELDRILTINYVDATVSHQYDVAGRKLRVDDTQFGGTFIAWTYDNANRLLSETTPQGVVSYTYNQANQKASMNVADRSPVNYSYDSAGRLSTISQNLGQGLEEFTYGYDILSRRTSLQRPNGVNSVWEYDQSDRLSLLKHQKAANIIEEFQYTYNADDEIASINRRNSQVLLSIDKLVSVADVNNRVSQFGNASYSFDDVGQTISKAITEVGTTTYQWDHRGRLVKVILANNEEVNYSYDAISRRITSSNSTISTAFLYDRKEVVQDINGSNSRIDYLNSFTIDEKLRQVSNAGLFYFTQDHLNSINALTDNNGDVVERINYDSFGDSVGSIFTRYGYTGRELDSLTNLIYYRARWYGPQQTKFLSEDFMGFDSGTNLYMYVENNPIINVDPSGNQCFKSADKAAEEALRKVFIPTKKDKTEYGGYICCVNNCFYYTKAEKGPAPMKRYSDGTDRAHTQPVRKDGCGQAKMVGRYHTHPPGGTEYLSLEGGDGDVLNFLKVPMYLGSPSGAIRKKAPGQETQTLCENCGNPNNLGVKGVAEPATCETCPK